MPRVEPYRGDRVPSQSIARVRRQAPGADAFGAGLGEGLTRVGLVAAQIAAEQRDRVDTLLLTTAKRQFNDLNRVQALSRDRGPEGKGSKGILLMEGRDPQDHMDANQGDWDEQGNMIVGQAKTTRQRELLTALRDEERARYQEQVQRHAHVEFAKYEVGEIQATLKSTVDTIGAMAGIEGGEAQIANQLATQERIIDLQGAKLGLHSEAERTRAKQELRSKGHIAAIDSLLDQGKDIAAQDYWNRVQTSTAAYPQGEILDSDARTIRTKLQVNSTDGAGERDATSIWSELGPKQEGDKVRTFDMQQAAKRLATTKDAQGRDVVDTKRYQRALDYLRVTESTWQAQEKNTQDVILDTLQKAVADGMPITQVKLLPAWKDASLGVQTATIKEAEARVSRQRSEARAAASYAEHVAGAPYRAFQQDEQMRTMKGYELYWDILNNPERLVDVPEEALSELVPLLGRQQMSDVRKLHATVRGNLTAASAVTVDREALKQMLFDDGWDWVNNTTLLPDQKRQLGAVLEAVERETEAEQIRQTKGTGRTVILDTAAQRQVMQRVIDTKAQVPGRVWGVTTVPAATVKQDDVGSAYISFKDLPEGGLREMRNYIRGLPDASGASPTYFMPNTEIDRLYAHIMERAWVQAERGAGPEVWQKMIRDFVAKTYRTPPAGPARSPGARPVPVTPRPPTRPKPLPGTPPLIER